MKNEIRHPSQAHFIGRWLTAPIWPTKSEFWISFLIGFSTYLLFWIVNYGISQSWVLSDSFLHKLQINFSFTIFVGVWFAQIAFSDISDWIQNAKLLLQTAKEKQGLEDYVYKELSNKKVWIFIVIIVGLGLLVVVMMAPNLPNGYFRFEFTNPLFIYVIVLEFCFFMLHLLGGTGFWILYVLSRSSQFLGTLSSLKLEFVDRTMMKFLMDGILKLCLLLFIIMISVAPTIWIIGMDFKSVPSVYFSIAFALTSLAISLMVFFFIPAYYLHRILLNAKKERILAIREQISQTRKSFLNSTKPKTNSYDINAILAFQETLTIMNDRLEKTNAESVWPYTIRSLTELGSGFGITIFSIYAQLISTELFP